MIYKLYRNIFKIPPPPERKKLFAAYYRKFGVDLIGVWQDKNNPLQFFMMTKFRDEEHHHTFTEQIKKFPEYNAMTQRINEIRIESENFTLEEI